ncbi:hypothetical protein [Sedimenticola hydrogenitrophicus]|uniref:hypothetical protein n=1 Tax=Sedimenticola hydrogenitrophicus TaxID=2967975 RepID=UPI0023B131D1|nr:hypothetical protein [Sedimenticola hydrogenitrophicus]
MELSNYFYRTLIYSEVKGQVHVYEKLPPHSLIPLDPWLGRVMQLADGQHTLQEMIDYVASQYQGDIPENYLKTIGSVIERLIETEAVALSQTPYTLPYHLAMPKEHQDPAVAERSMKEAGYPTA